MKFKKLFIILFSVLGIFLVLTSGLFLIYYYAQAIVISGGYFTNFNIEKSSFRAGEEIRGNFTIKNSENFVVPGLSYRFELLKEDEQGFFTITLDNKIINDIFFLVPGQELKKSFSYQLPKNLPSGVFKFRAQLFNPRGMVISWQDKMIKIEGGERFLTVSNPKLFKNGQSFSANGEAVFNSGESPKITFDISNKYSDPISAYAKINIYKYGINNNPLKEIKGKTITIEPQGIKNQEILGSSMQLDEPASYLAEVALYDNENNLISNFIYFRWQVLGKNIEILQLKTDKSSYIKEETAIVLLDIAVSPFQKEEKGKLIVKIFNEKERLVGKEEKEIDLRGQTIILQIPILKNISVFKIESIIVDKENKELDSYYVEIGRPQKKEKSLLGLISAIGISIIIGLIVFIIYFLRKKKYLFLKIKRFFLPVLFLLGSIFLFGAKEVLAYDVIECASQTSPDCQTLLSWVEPKDYTYDAIYEEGNYIIFEGLSYFTTGVNFSNPKEYKFRFFLADENGSGVIIKNDIDGTRIIDENSNVVKLERGGISEFSSFAERIDHIEHKIIFKIPFDIFSTLSLSSDRARAYIQIKIKDAANNWHYLIAYQKINIQKEGENGFDIGLSVDNTETEPGDTLTYNLSVSNKAVCMRFQSEIMLTMDRSSSMTKDEDGNDPLVSGKPTRISLAKNATNKFLDIIERRGSFFEQIGLVSYSFCGFYGGIEGVTLDHLLSLDFNSLRQAIASFGYREPSPFRTGTCISGAIRESDNELESARVRTEALKYQLLMSDGRATDRITDCRPGGIYGDMTNSDCARKIAREARTKDIIIYTIGFGKGTATASPCLMKDIAKITDNSYPESICSTPDELANNCEECYARNYFYAPGGEDLEKAYEAIAGLIQGKSFGTKTSLNLNLSPDVDFVPNSISDSRCSFDDMTKILTCDIGDLDCENQSGTFQFSFQVQIKSNAADGTQIKQKAVVSNDAGKEKESNEVITTVVINQPPNANNLSFNVINGCFMTNFSAIFSWTYSDPESTPQSAYQVRVDNDSNFSPPVVDSGKVDSSSTTYAVSGLDFNIRYYWQVKVWDNQSDSGWKDGPDVGPVIAYPFPNFSWSPAVPKINEEEVTFENQSNCPAAPCTYNWTFEKGNPSNSTEENPPPVKFVSIEVPGLFFSFDVSLFITDSFGRTCEMTIAVPMMIQLVPPKWKEIPPFSWLGNYFLKTMDNFRFLVF